MKDMKTVANGILETNKDSLKVAGKIVVGQTIINRIRAVAGKYIPETGHIRTLWDGAFGDLIISNFLLLLTNIYPAHSKLTEASECTNLAAAVSAKDKLNIQGMIDSLLDGIELPSAKPEAGDK